jgi:ribonucleoside-diphosphate reductase alpha chain
VILRDEAPATADVKSDVAPLKAAEVVGLNKEEKTFVETLKPSTPTAVPPIVILTEPRSADHPRPQKSAAFLYQQDAPSCSDCGAIMVRNGACYKCLNCGSTSGCS